MRYQDKPWSCGAAALVNAARVLGKRVAESRARTLAGTTEHNGTAEDGLIIAVRELGLTATQHHSSDVAAAWSFVRANVLDGHPCLICIDQWNHWVTVVGMAGDRVLVVDPANTAKNMAENGILVLSRRELTKRWRCKGEAEPFYALSVGK